MPLQKVSPLIIATYFIDTLQHQQTKT